MNAYLLPKQPVPLELLSLLMPAGEIVPALAAELARFDQNHLSKFCFEQGLYCLPTTELIDWLSQQIGGRLALEIGAGRGILGRALDIPMTDSHLQDGRNRFVVEHYKSLGQPLIRYPADVRKLTANSAILTYRPQVVVAAWVTQKVTDRREHERMGGNYWGVDETRFGRDGVETYIHVGHSKVHADKRILGQYPHQVYKLPFLFSRSPQPAGNLIYIFDCQTR